MEDNAREVRECWRSKEQKQKENLNVMSITSLFSYIDSNL